MLKKNILKMLSIIFAILALLLFFAPIVFNCLETFLGIKWHTGIDYNLCRALGYFIVVVTSVIAILRNTKRKKSK